MEIEYTKLAVKAIGRMDKLMKSRISRAVLGLTETPPKGDIKPLQGFSDGRGRLRVGKYRVVYRYAEDGKTVYIMDIDSRGDIYK
ncbi:type II toxin-antitoxin system RelE/ParE family toxin [Oscillospiraceae bacterium 42-9]